MENEKDLNTTTEAIEQEASEEVSKEEAQRIMQEAAEKLKKAALEAQTAMAEGKGILKLDKPIRASGEDVTELAYDFTELTGLEYADAMDADPNQSNLFKITHRQALNLFATAAAKATLKADKRDIMERIGTADALKGAQLAMLFFNASTRAGNLRISKK